MIRGIHHVALHTGNFDAMASFYREAFGFEPALEEVVWRENRTIDGLIDVPGSSARTLMLKAKNCYLELFEYLSPPGRTDPPLRPHDRGYTHFCVDVKNIEEEFQRLLKVGMTFPADAPGDFGSVKMIYGRDPDGNVIEIQELSSDHAFALEQLDASEIVRP
jgi:glyoxylase I family protein